jgi:Spy/CpxP family protein refolding chaperone
MTRKERNMKRIAVVVFFGLLLARTASAQNGAGGEDPFARYLFPPDRVIGHAREIGLDDAQRLAMRNDIHKAQARFLDLQFEMQTETEKMTRLLQEKPVDEARVLAQVDRMLAIEKDVKKTQVSLLVRIKNLLTPAQQAKLTELANESAK